MLIFKTAAWLALPSAVILVSGLLQVGEAVAATRTVKILVEVNDNTADRNPLRSFDGTKMSVKQAVAKAGRLKATSAISVVCEGSFKAGYIANDLVFSGNRWNREYEAYRDGTLMDVCMDQERSYLRKNPS